MNLKNVLILLTTLLLIGPAFANLVDGGIGLEEHNNVTIISSPLRYANYSASTGAAVTITVNLTGGETGVGIYDNVSCNGTDGATFLGLQYMVFYSQNGTTAAANWVYLTQNTSAVDSYEFTTPSINLATNLTGGLTNFSLMVNVSNASAFGHNLSLFVNNLTLDRHVPSVAFTFPASGHNFTVVADASIGTFNMTVNDTYDSTSGFQPGVLPISCYANIFNETENSVILGLNTTSNNTQDIYLNDNLGSTAFPTYWRYEASFFNHNNRYMINVTCNDSVGNSNTTENLWFAVDWEAPEINSFSPTSAYITNSSVGVWSWSITDPSFTNCTMYYWDNGDGASTYGAYGTDTVINTTYYADDSIVAMTLYNTTLFSHGHTLVYYMNCTDANGNVSATGNYTATVDVDAPYITYVTPESGGSVTGSTLTLKVKTDTDSTCTYTPTGGSVTSMTAATSGLTHTAAITGLTTGSESYAIICTDLASNARTATLAFTVSAGTTSTTDLTGAGLTTGTIPKSPAYTKTSDLSKTTTETLTTKLLVADIAAAKTEVYGDADVTETSVAVSQGVGTTATVSHTSAGSKVSNTVTYTGEQDVKDLTVVYTVPSSFATDMETVTVTAEGATVAQVGDSSFAVTYATVRNGAALSIDFVTTKKVSRNLVKSDWSAPVILAEELTAASEEKAPTPDEKQPAGTEPTATATPTATPTSTPTATPEPLPITTIVIALVVLVVIGYAVTTVMKGKKGRRGRIKL